MTTEKDDRDQMAQENALGMNVKGDDKDKKSTPEDRAKKERDEKEKQADAIAKEKQADPHIGPSDFSGTKFSPNAPDGQPPTEEQMKAHEADVHPSQAGVDEKGKAKTAEHKPAAPQHEERARRG
jgi:hypothetical protein